MYDERVKRLRDYEESGLFPISPYEAGEAADAIEELTAIAGSYKRSMEAWADEAARAKPRWIPVTERLPKDGSDVLAYLDSRITAANYFKGTWQDCVMGRLYLTEEGFVTHWMPLPEPPKEEA